MGFNFGAMVGGFVDGVQAGEKMKNNRAQRDYMKLRGEYLKSQMDPEMQRTKLDLMKARISATLTGSGSLSAMRANSIKNSNSANSRADEQQQWMRDDRANKPVGPAIAPLGPPPGPQSALPEQVQVGQNDDEDDNPQVTANDDDDDEEDQPVQQARRGGVVRAIPHYAEGGAVEDRPESDPQEAEDDDDEDDSSAAPEETGQRIRESAIPVAGSTGAPAARSNAKMEYNAQAGHDAVLAGIKYNLDQTDVAQGMGIDMSAKSRRYGAVGPKALPAKQVQTEATAQQIEQIKDKLDEHHQYPESQRTMAAFSALWQWNLGRGDTHGAEQASAAMVNYYGAQFNRYKAIAEAAASKGDVDTTIKAAIKAYDNVPDGQDIDVKKDAKGNLSYTLTGENGKVLQRQVMSPDQVLGWVTHGGIQNFEQLVATASGNRAQPGGKGKGDGGLKSGDYDKIDTAMDKAATKYGEDNTPDGEKVPVVPAKELTDTKSAATQIMLDKQNRGHMMPRDAYGVAASLADPDPKKPQAQTKNTEGGKLVKFGSSPPVFVPQAQFDQLTALRADRIKAAKKPDDQPGVFERVGRAVKGAYNAGTAAAASAKPRNESPVEHPSTFAIPPTTSMDDAPEGSVPRRGLGER